MLGWKRWTLRRKINSQTGYPANFLLQRCLMETVLLSNSPPVCIRNSNQEHREFHSGAFIHGWRGEWIFSLSFHLFLSTSEHRGSQHIYMTVSLSTGRCFNTTNQKKRWLSLYMAHLKLWTILCILPNPWGIFLITLKISTASALQNHVTKSFTEIKMNTCKELQFF
jgi:hypothetical protein